MKKFLLALLLTASPAWAQTNLAPKGATARIDNCVPIGRTAKGELVYSMKCDNLPAPAAAAAAGRGQGNAAAGAGGSTERPFRLVLRPKEA